MQINTEGDRRGKSEGSTPSSVILWRPDVVLARVIASPKPPPSVKLAEPYHRPESVSARVETARSMLSSLADARGSLTSRMTLAQDRARFAQTERERVAATFDAYRLEATLDEVLTTTSTQVSMLMKERGL